ncbi:MAG: RNB domain-containing ribonuclease [Deltaproteobacteria bacterium]|jgi:exoribonuclease-2|nr:RNB domain-containing ribonuclease [Deltaproteobacteria bacterium]
MSLIVEFLEAGEFWLAVALDDPTAKSFTALNHHGQIVRLVPSRVLSTLEFDDPGDKEARLAILTDLKRHREALAASLNLEEIWSFLQGEGPEFSYELLAGLAYGHEPSADEISAARRAILNEGTLFAFNPQFATLRDPLSAAQKKAIKERNKAHAEFLTEAGAWLRDSVAKKMAFEPESGEKVRKLLLDLALLEGEAPDPRTAKELLKAASLPENEDGAFTALVAIGEFHEREPLEIRRLGLGQPFSPAELKAAAKDPKDFLNDPGRLDLTHLSIVTVDSKGAKEFDDALSLSQDQDGNYNLGLHIADVAAAVKPGDILDLAAFARGASVYLPDAKYPMLPEPLADDLLSLKVGVTRPAFSLLVTLSPKGEPLKYAFTPTLIKVSRQMSFDEADSLLDQDHQLTALANLSQILLKRRLNLGGLNLNLPQLQVRLAPDGQIVWEKTLWDTPAKLMVGEMMVLANYLAAEALAEAHLAAPFRFQEKPRLEPDFTQEPTTDLEALAQDLALRRRLGRSGVSLAPAPHFGLGLAYYVQFTSPLRRYPDLLVARQLRFLKDPQNAPYDAAKMTEKAFVADDLNRAIRRAQNNRNRYFLTLWLEQRLGQEFSGLVFERLDRRRTRICLTDFMLEIELYKVPAAAKPGREVRLKLVAAEAKSQTLRFECLGLGEKEPDPPAYKS